jgi:D-alanyl-D-alanine carboxypeptidase
MTQPHAAGALVSTVGDLLKWNRALHEGRVLKSDSYQKMITPIGAAAAQHYGFGIQHETLRDHDVLDHGGGIFGFVSYLLYLPESDTSVAVLQNTDSGTGRYGPEEIARKLAAVAIGEPYPEKKPIAVDVAALKSLEGVYRIDADSARVLRVVDGKLTSQRTGGVRSELTPIAKDLFLYEDGFNRLSVERDADGAVIGMRFFPYGEGAGQVVALSKEPLPTDKPSITLPRAALERVAGTYVGDGVEMRVFLDGEQLKTQLAGQPAFDLFAESASRFFLKVVDATLEFNPVEGVVKSATLHQGGQVIGFERK